MIVLAGVLCLFPSVSGQSPDRFGDAFWKHWGDGRAELSGYTLTFPRYGQPRTGTAVAIWVTETFDHDARVKTDSKHGDRGKAFPVMKLNLVQDFQTGIYDYNLMTCVFVALTPIQGLTPGSVAKASFSSQEWCGHAYQQIIPDRDSVRHQLHSYFEGEADQDRSLGPEPNGVYEDALLMWARGFAGPTLKPGARVTIPLLRSMQVCRLSHTPLLWDTVTLSRSNEPRRITVPAGDFEVDTYTAKIDRHTPSNTPRLDWMDPRVWTIEVEKEAPHRVIRWSINDGFKAELLKSERLKYWGMHGNGQESSLEKIGLTAPQHPSQ